MSVNCKTCIHNDVCKYKDDLQKYIADNTNHINFSAASVFTVDIKCKYYIDTARPFITNKTVAQPNSRENYEYRAVSYAKSDDQIVDDYKQIIDDIVNDIDDYTYNEETGEYVKNLPDNSKNTKS